MSGPPANQDSSPLSLPIVTVQPTTPSVIQDVHSGLMPSDKIWVSCYKADEPSVHAKVQVSLDEVRRDIVDLTSVEGDVEVVRGHGHSWRDYDVACKPLSIPHTKVLFPIQEYLDPERSNPQHPQRITAFDISADKSQFATGFLDGSVFLYPTTPFEPVDSGITQTITPPTSRRRVAKPHLSTVTSLRFFPSSRVLLSSGADFSLSILPADLPTEAPSPSTSARVTPARTLRAHTRAITSTAIIALGRNILSSSLDSTLKLWDVSSGSVISSLPARSAVLSTSLGDRTPFPPYEEDSSSGKLSARDSREVPEVQSKVVFAGLQSGSFEVFDLWSKASVYHHTYSNTATSPLPSAAPLSSISYSHQHNLLATGSSAGTVTIYDTRNLHTALISFKRNDAGIEDLAFVSPFAAASAIGDADSVGLAIATTDGLPYIARIAPEGPGVGVELVGVDCDGVRSIRVRGEGEGRDVWSAGDDAVVRRYII